MTEKEKQNRRLDEFTWNLVCFLRFPQPFELGLPTILRDVIRVLTKGNRTLRKKAFEWIDLTIEETSDYDVSAYMTTDIEEAKKEIKKDYDTVFYK